MLQGLEGTEELISDDGKFCLGDEVTAADLFVYPMVINCLTRHEVNLGKFPKIKRVMENMKDLEFVQVAHPKNQPDTPVGQDFSNWEY